MIKLQSGVADLCIGGGELSSKDRVGLSKGVLQGLTKHLRCLRERSSGLEYVGK